MRKLFILPVAMLMMYSCGGSNKPAEQIDATKIETSQAVSDEHNARNSLDYMGTYRGTLPTASGEGMEVTLIVSDSTYFKSVTYIGKMTAAMVDEGQYTWNKAGNTIILSGGESPDQYFVAEGKIFQLDMDGKKVEGDLADHYILTKSE